MIAAASFALGCLLALNAPARLATAVPRAQVELREELRRRVRHYSLERPNFVAALTSLASEFRLPMGIEWVQRREALRPVKLSWKDATVGDMIHAIVNTQPGYTYEVSSGIVHVLRKDLLHSPKNFLEIKLTRFAANDELPGIVSRRLRDTVKRVVAPPPVSSRGGGEAGSYGTGVGEVPMTFSLDNVTVREVLNHVATSTVFRIWIVTFEAGTLTNSRYLRTVSLWNPSLPREEQPVWDLMVWGRLPSQLSPQ